MSEDVLAKYPGLYLRGGVWYVRKKVPIDLRHFYNSDQVRKSLETDEKHEALRFYATKKAEIDREFEVKRVELGHRDKITHSLLTGRLERLSPAEIDTLVWDWWENRAKARRPNLDEFDVPGEGLSVEEVLSAIEGDLQDVLTPRLGVQPGARGTAA